MNKAQKMAKKAMIVRAATAVEYVFLLVFIMIAVAATYRTLADKVKAKATDASTTLDG